MDSSKNQGLTVLFSLIFCICSIRSSFFYGKDAFPFGDGCFTLHGKINVFFHLSNALTAVFQTVEALNPGDIPVIKNTTIIMNAFDIWYKALIAVELERFIRKFCLWHACFIEYIHYLQELSPAVTVGCIGCVWRGHIIHAGNAYIVRSRMCTSSSNCIGWIGVLMYIRLVQTFCGEKCILKQLRLPAAHQ